MLPAAFYPSAHLRFRSPTHSSRTPPGQLTFPNRAGDRLEGIHWLTMTCWPGKVLDAWSADRLLLERRAGRRAIPPSPFFRQHHGRQRPVGGSVHVETISVRRAVVA